MVLKNAKELLCEIAKVSLSLEQHKTELRAVISLLVFFKISNQ